jgi:hypothetical protein
MNCWSHDEKHVWWLLMSEGEVRLMSATEVRLMSEAKAVDAKKKKKKKRY